MGDRGNIVIRQSKDTNRGDVWFYSHWGGYGLKSVVQRALTRRERWEDETYLARIVFCELVKGIESEPTGIGISTRIGDNEHDIVVVDVPGQRIFEMKEAELKDGRLLDSLQPDTALSFEEFVSQPVLTNET